MIKCSRCGKRPAVVFVSSTNPSDPTKAMKNEGLCLSCARELKIPQVEDYMKKLGITDEYEGIGHWALGYKAEPLKDPAPRKDNYVYYI